MPPSTRPPEARRRALALLVAALLSFLAKPADAARMFHHDLASLAFESDAIVLARRGPVPQRSTGETVIEHRVLETYTGPLRPGDLVAVPYDGVVLEPTWGWPRPAPGATAGVLSDEVVLFLRPTGSDEAGAPPWLLVDLRIFRDGQAYRFEQRMNPGPYEPVPQRADPFDIMGDPRAGAPLDQDGLRRAIDAAVARARAAHEAIAERATHEGRRKLVDLIGPPADDDDAPVPVGHVSSWDDRIATKAIEALASTGDLDALLDGVARRVGGVSYPMLPQSVSGPSLLAAAASRAVPLHRRLAALTLLEIGRFHLSSELKPSTKHAPQIASLYDDPEPEVRAAALDLRFSAQAPPPPVEAAILARWGRETDPHVQWSLLGSADHFAMREKLLGSHDVIEPIVWARRRRRVVDIFLMNTRERRHHVSRVVITARAGDRAAGTLDLTPDMLSGSASARTEIEHAFLAFTPPLAPGRYALDLRVDIEDDEKQHASRRFTLPAFRVGGAEASTSPPARSAPTGMVPPPVPPPRSCACAAPGRASEADEVETIVLLCVGLAAARRRRRAAPRAA
ncbi:hypothetical protein [Polyangium sp. y55x31]|uniref:hypothetical protein n=1 Tax=Polyangium sp. y55x31 TaxID=3042688 RepID=UPI002482F0DB|nr:hypothetical protein [Polyangium sp. y55x31]MDI1475424.1 hypothetical protein [Polyangium sp. y55x31]